jgi:hypothetical protein
MDTNPMKNKSDFTVPPRKGDFISAATGPEKLPEASSKTYGGLLVSIHIAKRPSLPYMGVRYVLTFSMELKRSSVLSSLDGCHYLN